MLYIIVKICLENILGRFSFASYFYLHLRVFIFAYSNISSYFWYDRQSAGIFAVCL